ncbi:unnamed protein product [Allacma fusca]|uniref:Uncharacterized protein n=1 Tax=Allacma fusca TaxID=39272 RepID=A0A8J2NR84_9HEXA|nr:unnamed protein product [Allacma fusca]
MMALITSPRLLSFVLTNILLFISIHGQHIRLEPWRIRDNSVTLSGFSSGGTFAQQMQFSYPSLFSGIAVFSHTYYRCGPGNGIQKDYDDACTKLDNPPASQLYDPNMALNDIQRFYEQRLIGNPAFLQNKKLYVFTGLRNFLFTPEMSLNILKLYEPMIQNSLNIRTRVMDAELLLPSDSYGGKCTDASANTDYIGNCGFSGALESLQFLLGPSIKRPGNERLEPLQTFNQREFFIPERHDMDDVGFVYVPKACKLSNPGRDRPGFGGSRPAECYLHFYFHGCFSGRDFLGMNHTVNSGFLQVAEANNIIMVFPQSVKSPENDIGCWDTYGFTGKDFATRKGAQVQVVHKMLQRVLGNDIQFPEDNRDTREPVKTQNPRPEDALPKSKTGSRNIAQLRKPFKVSGIYLHHVGIVAEAKEKDLECFNCFHLDGEIDTLDYPCLHDEDNEAPPKDYLNGALGLIFSANKSNLVPRVITDMEARFAKRAKVSGKSKGIFGFHCTATTGRLGGEVFLIRYKSLGEISKPNQVECSTQWENPEPFGDLITEGIQCVCGYKACNGFNLNQNNRSGSWNQKLDKKIDQNVSESSQSFLNCSILIITIVYQLITISDISALNNQ